MKSLRTMQLNGTLTVDGYDTVEANSNGVAVEERPAGAGGSGTGSGRSGSYFQDDFAQKLKTDPDMLERGEGIVAIAASLSRSHLNCSMRNIIGGKKGRACPQDKAKRECASCPILNGNQRQLQHGELESS